MKTEFSRCLRENADHGTDHGYGADTLVLGGSVNGSKIYGDWPGLRNDQLFEGQDIKVTTDFRHILSEILIRRMHNAYLGTIFPGYADYQPLGVVTGADIPPVYDTNTAPVALFSNGFED